MICTLHRFHTKYLFKNLRTVSISILSVGSHCQDVRNKNYPRYLKTFDNSKYKTYIQNKLNFKLKPINVTKGLYNSSPASLKPYLDLIRFDKPIGSWLLFYPGAWSISLAADSGCIPDLHLLSLFALGAFLMRSSGCIINDMWDSDFDKKVERTRNRPIASNKLTHHQALFFLAGTLSCSLSILLTFNWYSVFLGASSMLFVVAYPLMKRFTYWPQLFLGLTINWGALLGWSAVHGVCNWPVCLPLYVSAISWTMLYDTVYSHQDKKDDILIDVKSTALLFGDYYTKPMLTLFAASMASGMFLAGYNSGQVWPFYLSLCGVSSHLVWQIKAVDLASPSDCASKFRSNRYIGIVLLGGIIASTLLK